jgi:PhnB protein
MQLNPYLNFKGDCEAAFTFYQRCLGGKIAFKMTFGDSPMAQQAPPGWKDKIMHMRLEIGDRILMGSDAPPERYAAPKGFSVSLTVDQPAEAERVFHALADNASVQMPLAETFWAARFGMLVDRFGIPWMVNCEKQG